MAKHEEDLEAHIIQKMEDGKATAWCGVVFDTGGNWEFRGDSLCWRCIQRSNDYREWVILAEVVQAGEDWAVEPDSGPVRARLKRAIDQLADWMDPGDSYVIIEP